MKVAPSLNKATAELVDTINALPPNEAIPLLIASLGLAVKNATNNDIYKMMGTCLPVIINDLCKCWDIEPPRIEMFNETRTTH